ncbi:MAG: TIGR03546 family protein [Alkalispirochaeta sp.]
MLITWIARIIAALNANRRPGEIAAAVATGVLLALMPAGNLLWIGIFTATLFLKLNFGMELLVIAILKGIVPLADPALHSLGAAVLTNERLYPLFTALYNVPIVPFTRFNNTVVAGGFVAGVVLWIPLFFLSRLLVVVYRKKVHPRIANSKLVKAFQRIPFVSRITRLARKFQRVYSVVA